MIEYIHFVWTIGFTGINVSGKTGFANVSRIDADLPDIP